MPPPATITSVLGTFLQQLQADGRSPHTVAQYRRHVRVFAAWAKQERRVASIDAVNVQMLAAFLTTPAALQHEGRPKCASSVNALRSSLRVFFAHAHAAGWIGADPSRLVRRAVASSPPPRPMADADLERLLATVARDGKTAARRDHALFVLLAEAGLRLGSALALDVSDVDLSAGEASLRSAKGGARQVVLLTRHARSALRPLLRGRHAGPVFRARSGGRLSTRHAQRRFAEWLARARADRRTTLHSLRHRFATRLYRETRDVFLVKQALGHRSIASTMVYVEADRDRLRAAMGT